MPGHGAAGSEKELPARSDSIVRLSDISEPMIPLPRTFGAGKTTSAVIICRNRRMEKGMVFETVGRYPVLALRKLKIEGA